MILWKPEKHCTQLEPKYIKLSGTAYNTVRTTKMNGNRTQPAATEVLQSWATHSLVYLQKTQNRLTVTEKPKHCQDWSFSKSDSDILTLSGSAYNIFGQLLVDYIFFMENAM